MKAMFGNKARRKQKAMEIDITSLLDILVILLVFLLKSYNASDLKLNLVNKLTLPTSQTRKLGNHSIIIQVDKYQKVWVKNQELGSTASSSDKMDELYDYLMTQNARALSNNKSPTKKINLVFDKDLPYQSIKKIMHTCATAGLTEFKFIVKGNF
jgi:biopolymer transport protein ExbD